MRSWAHRRQTPVESVAAGDRIPHGGCSIFAHWRELLLGRCQRGRRSCRGRRASSPGAGGAASPGRRRVPPGQRGGWRCRVSPGQHRSWRRRASPGRHGSQQRRAEPGAQDRAGAAREQAALSLAGIAAGRCGMGRSSGRNWKLIRPPTIYQALAEEKKKNRRRVGEPAKSRKIGRGGGVARCGQVGSWLARVLNIIQYLGYPIALLYIYIYSKQLQM